MAIRGRYPQINSRPQEKSVKRLQDHQNAIKRCATGHRLEAILLVWLADFSHSPTKSSQASMDACAGASPASLASDRAGASTRTKDPIICVGRIPVPIRVLITSVLPQPSLGHRLSHERSAVACFLPRNRNRASHFPNRLSRWPMEEAVRITHGSPTTVSRVDEVSPPMTQRARGK